MAEKKKFFDVEIPALGTNVKLIAYSLENLNNRTIKMDLTRQLRGKSMEALINIKVEGEKATGNLAKLSLLGFFIRRMMRNNISYVEDSFSAESLNSTLRVKPFLITRKKVTRAVRKALRETAKSYLNEYFQDKDSEEIFGEIIDNKLQRSLSLKLKKVYPLALCEIREIKIESFKHGPQKAKKEKVKEKEEEREKTQIEEIEEAQKAKESEQAQ